MSNVRVTHAGLISFAVGILSLFTGLIFTLIVTRRLSLEEFGTWSLITNIIFYLLISETIISFWAIRQISRGEEVGKTTVISSGIFILGMLPFYLALSYILGKLSDADLDALIFGVILLPVFFISQTLGGINVTHKPQAVSYGLLVFEIVKIPAGLSLVYFLDLGVEGAIISVTFAYLIRIIIQLKFAQPKLKNRFNIKILKRWIRLSWVSLYSSLTRVTTLLDVFIYPLITGSVLGIAYFSASLAIASLAAQSSTIAQALGPKLLAKGDLRHIPNNLTLMMYFGIPLLGISILFSKAGLFALNPLYESAYIIVIFLSFKTFFFTLNYTLHNILASLETVDVEEKPKFSQLRKSLLFIIPTGRYVNSLLYLPTFSIIIFFLYASEIEELELVTWWAILSLSFEIPFFIFLIILLHKKTKFELPLVPISKYIGATIVFGIVFYFTSDFIINHEISIFNYLPSLIAELLICMSVYFAITYITDQRTRNLLTSILHEFGFSSRKPN